MLRERSLIDQLSGRRFRQLCLAAMVVGFPIGVVAGYLGFSPSSSEFSCGDPTNSDTRGFGRDARVQATDIAHLGSPETYYRELDSMPWIVKSTTVRIGIDMTTRQESIWGHFQVGGSGSIIEYDDKTGVLFIMTAAHVLNPHLGETRYLRAVGVTNYLSNESVAAGMNSFGTATHPTKDIGVIGIPVDVNPFYLNGKINFSNEAPDNRTTILYGIGYPYMAKYNAGIYPIRANMNGESSYDKNIKWLRLCASVTEGASGTGLFDSNNELTGIICCSGENGDTYAHPLTEAEYLILKDEVLEELRNLPR